jgi:uncharacterized protein
MPQRSQRSQRLKRPKRARMINNLNLAKGSRASLWVVALLACVALSSLRPDPASAQAASTTPPPSAVPNAASERAASAPTSASQKLTTTLGSASDTTKDASKNAGKEPAEPTKAAPDTRKLIALILPTASKTLNKAAEAIRAGAILANEVNGKETYAIRTYSADDDAAALPALYRKAVAEGAIAIIGGMTRDGATVISKEAGFVPTIALNTTADATRVDANNYFQLSLAVEWDARLAAQAIAQESYRNIAIISDASPLSKRIQEAFEREWARVGGTVADRLAYSGNQAEAPRIRTAFSKGDAAKADAVFFAASMTNARATRPYVPQGLPVFATAYTFDPRAGPLDNIDLDSMRFLEMPWFAEPDHTAVMAYARPAEPLPADYERLYALGIDAWRVVFQLLTTQNSPINASPTRAVRNFPPIDGVTGKITLDGNQFVRGLALIEIRDGRRTLVKSAD